MQVINNDYKWIQKKMANFHPNTVADFNRIYSYDNLKYLFKWAKIFRAGFVVIYKSESACELLLVKQKLSKDKLVGFYGPPKGQRMASDKSALETAARELFEETGIDLNRESDKIKFKPVHIALMRGSPIFEIIIYFMIVVHEKIDIKICKDELESYEWFDMRNGLKNIKNVSAPTRDLFQILEDIQIPD